MRPNFAVSRKRWLSVGAFIALLMLMPDRLIGATVWVVSFTIDDTYPNAKVTSDLVTNGLPIAYPDYRLLAVPDDAGCVEAELTSGGHLHAVFNRRVDETTRCNPLGSDRQYRVRLTAAPLACGLLADAYGIGNVLLDGDNCDLVYSDNPRVRVADLFKKGARSTPVALLSGMFPENEVNGRSYEIRTLENAALAAPDANQRVVTYDGQAMLFEFGNGKSKFVAEAFDLNLRMVFDRTALP